MKHILEESNHNTILSQLHHTISIYNSAKTPKNSLPGISQLRLPTRGDSYALAVWGSIARCVRREVCGVVGEDGGVCAVPLWVAGHDKLG